MMVTQIYGTLFCARCLETMGKVDPEELKALIDLEPDGPVCMACEPGPAEELPDIANDWEEGHMLWFGDELFIALRSDDLKGDWLSFSHECARALAQSCLSSSTYLNKTPQERANEILGGLKPAESPDPNFAYIDTTVLLQKLTDNETFIDEYPSEELPDGPAIDYFFDDVWKEVHALRKEIAYRIINGGQNG